MTDFLQKLKSTKGSLLLILGLSVGILLFLLGGGSGEKKEEKAPAADPSECEKTLDLLTVLESRVCELLSHMDGISDVHVILTPDATKETVYAQNGSYSGGVLTEREYVLADIDGDDTPLVIKLIFPKLRGIAVVCRGGSNPINQEKIVSLLCSLFDLPASRVYVTG